MIQSLSRQIVNHWKALPWYLKIASILMLVFAAVVFIFELIARIAPRLNPNPTRDPYIEISRRKQKDMEYQRDDMKRKIEQYDLQYKLARERFEKASKELNGVEKQIDDCNDIDCIDDILRRKYGPGDDSGAR